MDRNTIIGLVLIAGIIMTWSIFMSPEKPKDDPQGQKQTTSQALDSVNGVAGDSGKTAVTAVPTIDPDNFIPKDVPDSVWAAMTDSAKTAVMSKEKDRRFGDFAKLREGEEKLIIVETDKYYLGLTNKGGYVRSLYLKEYTTYDGKMLPIMVPSDSNYMQLFFNLVDDVQFPTIQTKELYFQANSKKDTIKLTGGSTEEVVFRAQIDDLRFFEFVYNFQGDRYDYGFKIRHNGLTGMVRNQDISMHWQGSIPRTEKAMQLMRDKTAIYYREAESVDWVNPRGSNFSQEEHQTGVDWFAFKSQFFSHTIMSVDEKQDLGRIVFEQGNPPPEDINDPNVGSIVKGMYAEVSLNLGYDAAGERDFLFFAGPLDYDLLTTYERGMIYQIELGWGPLKLVNRFIVIPLFNLLQGIFSSYGIIIFLLAFLIKMALYPLTFRTYKSTAKMRIINQTPEIKALEEKYKDEPTKLQQEKMGIYRQMGVSMLGGCWPMLLQYPFLIALFFFFPNSIELRQESFLWAEDLSTYDSILELGFNIPMYGNHVSLFTLLMTISIFAFTLINQKAQGTVTNNAIMKYFPYIMPLIFLGFLNNYSAGLSWYYLISNLISITQTLVTKRYIDEEKLLAQMRANAKNKGKKGKPGKGRLERWADRQQQRQKETQQAKSSQRRGGGGNGQGGGRKKRK